MKRMIGAAAQSAVTNGVADVRPFSDSPLIITSCSNADNHVTTMVDDCIVCLGRPGGGGWLSKSEEDEVDLTRTDCADLFKKK